MIDQYRKIPFYKVRSFGEKFDDTFGFVRQNMRYIWRYLLYAILPVGLIMGLMMQWYMSALISADAERLDDIFMSPGYWVMIVLSIVCGAFVVATIFSLIQFYNNQPDGLLSVSTEALRPYVYRNTGRVLKLFLAAIVLIVAYMLLVVLAVYGLRWLSLVVVPATFILGVVSALVPPVYIFENVSVLTAIRRGFHLGWKTFGGVLAVLIVFYIIIYVATILFALPWYVCIFVQTLTIDSNSAETFASSPAFSIISYFCSVLFMVGSMACSLLMIVAVSYQYAHAAEKVDGVSVEEGIDDFEQLA